LRLLLELKWRLDSTLNSRQGFAHTTTTKLEPLQVENYKMTVVSWFPQSGAVFRRVQGGVTDLIKSVTCQVFDGRPSHMVGWPSSSASTNFQLWIPFYCLLESVPVKPTRERLQSGVGRPGSLAGWPTPGPTSQWPSHTASFWQVHSRGDTYFGGIPIFLVISWNASIWHLCSWNQINTKIMEIG
jgi:hypothetical protein